MPSTATLLCKRTTVTVKNKARNKELCAPAGVHIETLRLISPTGRTGTIGHSTVAVLRRGLSCVTSRITDSEDEKLSQISQLGHVGLPCGPPMMPANP